MTAMSCWRGLCRQSGVAPLKLVPFLPQDNISSSSGNNTASSTNTLARANAELGRCLMLPFPVFMSFVLEDAALGKFMDTFLRFRRRHYEFFDAVQPADAEEHPSLPELGRRVFMVLLRAVGSEHACLTKEVNGTPGELLVSESGMLSPAAVLDACALYGRSNPAPVARLLRSLAELDGGAVGVRLAEGLAGAGLAAARALGEVHAKVAGAHDGVGGPSVGPQEASDLLSYITDVAVTVGSLLQAWDGGGGGGSLAARLQGTAGEVSPEGFAAALALTFEATLPTLEGMMTTGGQSTGEGQDQSVAAARGRLARQWLLRCLHRILGPVFLETLGLQQVSSCPKENDNGAAKGPGAVRSEVVASTAAAADGLFRFMTSLTAASAHLAPPEYAGSLLGEYNTRFRLAEALEQAEALAMLPPTPAENNTTRGGVAETKGNAGGRGWGGGERRRGGGGERSLLGTRTGTSLGPERTEYLAGLLRALPVSDSGVSTPEEAVKKVEAAASAEAMMASALERGVVRDGGGNGGGEGEGGDWRGSDPDELDDLIKSVQAVLGGPEEPGGVGAGFVEACLSVFRGSPQAVIEGVLEDRLPPQVAGLDRGLRRAWKGKKGDLDKAYRVDKGLAAAEAQRVIAMEKRQEDDAYLLSREYDDDYDDQYDGRGVDVGGGGASLGDMETVRRVNQLVRQEEEEVAWWDTNKNTNRSVPPPNGRGWRAGASKDSDDEDDTGGQRQQGVEEEKGRGGRGGGGVMGQPGGGGTGMVEIPKGVGVGVRGEGEARGGRGRRGAR